MGKKLFLNVAYTIGLVIAGITAYWGAQHNNYAYTVGGVIVVLLFLYLKAQLLKEIRNSQRK